MSYVNRQLYASYSDLFGSPPFNLFYGYVVWVTDEPDTLRQFMPLLNPPAEEIGGGGRALVGDVQVVKKRQVPFDDTIGGIKGTFTSEAAPAPSPGLSPSIAADGPVAVGTVVTSSTGSWVLGQNSAGQDIPIENYEFEWRRNGVAIPGEDGDTYTLALADEGTNITLRIRAMGWGQAPSSWVETNTIAVPAAPSLTPEDLAGVTGWYRGDDAVEVGGDITWTNRIVAGPEMTEVNSAASSIVTVGGQPAVDFLGGAYQIGGAENLWIAANNWHVFALVSVSGAPTLNAANWWQNHLIVGDVSGWWGIYASTVGLYGYVYNGAQYRTTPIPFSTGVPLLLEYWRDPSGIHFRVNDSAVATLAGSYSIGNGGSSSMHVSADAIVGGVAEYAFSPTFDAVNQSDIRNYFAARYGVAV